MTTKRTDKPADRFEITKNMTNYEKALAGEWYIFGEDQELHDRVVVWARGKYTEINKIALEDKEKAMDMLVEFAPGIDRSCDIVFPVQVEYPEQITIGANTFINNNFICLSGGKITIGKHCFIGPNCSLFTPNHHPSDIKLRREGWQYDAPISIGNDVWFGGNVTICPGVSIGDNVVVGAGAVVTKDIPSNCIVGGNPAKIIKELAEE
jgi:maltose O-acetyltransferase